MNDDRSTKPTSKIRALAGIAGACVAVIVIVVLVYTLTMPPSPEEAAESYIEDHYDAVAEAIVHAAFPDNSLTAEVIAEVAESIAERVIPYRCDENKDYRATVGIRCDLSFSLDKPLELRIYAPFQVILATTDRDFLGRTTPVVQDANPITAEMAVNGISLDDFIGAENKAQEVKESLENLGSKILNPPTEVMPTEQPSETTITRPAETPDPTKQPPPTDLPREIAESGICGRTPEIQKKLIEMLKIRSCQVINAAELYRVREFSASAQSLKVGDFDDLPNLLSLSISLEQEKANTLDPGIFQDLHSLNSLEINSGSPPTIRLNKDTFMGLNNLTILDIEYIEHLPDEALDHLQQLTELNISFLKGDIPSRLLDQLQQLTELNISYLKGDIPSRLLDQLQNVEYISITNHIGDENSTPPTLPTDFLKNLPKLRGVDISHEYLPDSMEVNSYETACQIEKWSLQDKKGKRIPMAVDGKILEIIDRTKDHDPINERDIRICHFNVGDTDTKKIIIPLE